MEIFLKCNKIIKKFLNMRSEGRPNLRSCSTGVLKRPKE